MCSETVEFLKEITLRNNHRVYSSDEDFRVVSVKERGVEYTRIIPSENIERLIQLCKGKTVTVKQAAILFGANCDDLDLPYTYGHKFEYYVQDMLLVLVANGKAKIDKKSRSYIYHIGSL